MKRKERWHLFEVNDHKYVLRTDRIAFCEIDREGQNFIKHLQQSPTPGLLLEQIHHSPHYRQLYQSGVLSLPLEVTGTGKTELQHRYLVNELVLNIDQRCNLSCRYCYAYRSSDRMSQKTAYAAIDFLARQSLHSADIAYYKITFFGGEPLLSREIIEETVRYAKQRLEDTGRPVRFGLVTNGLLLDERVVQLCNSHEFVLTVSLDGPQEVHDRARVTESGRGSFQHVVQNVKRYLPRIKGVRHVSATIAPYHVNLIDTARFLRGLGFDALTLDPVAGNQSGEFYFTAADLPHLRREYTALACYYADCLSRGDLFVLEPFYHRLLQLLWRRSAQYGCNAGYTVLNVAPSGDLVACYRQIGDPRFVLGNVYDGLQPRAVELLYSYRVDKREPCRYCWARLYCGGGCYVEPLLYYNNINRIHTLSCEFVKTIIELSVYIISRLPVSIKSQFFSFDHGDSIPRPLGSLL